MDLVNGRMWHRLVFVCCVIGVFSSFVAAQDMLGAIVAPVSTVVCLVYVLVVYGAGFVGSLMIVVYGVKWLTSAENPDERKQAKHSITTVFLGLIVIVVAYGIISVLAPDFGGCADAPFGP